MIYFYATYIILVVLVNILGFLHYLSMKSIKDLLFIFCMSFVPFVNILTSYLILQDIIDKVDISKLKPKFKSQA